MSRLPGACSSSTRRRSTSRSTRRAGSASRSSPSSTPTAIPTGSTSSSRATTTPSARSSSSPAKIADACIEGTARYRASGASDRDEQDAGSRTVRPAARSAASAAVRTVTAARGACPGRRATGPRRRDQGSGRGAHRGRRSRGRSGRGRGACRRGPDAARCRRVARSREAEGPVCGPLLLPLEFLKSGRADAGARRAFPLAHGRAGPPLENEQWPRSAADGEGAPGEDRGGDDGLQEGAHRGRRRLREGRGVAPEEGARRRREEGRPHRHRGRCRRLHPQRARSASSSR